VHITNRRDDTDSDRKNIAVGRHARTLRRALSASEFEDDEDHQPSRGACISRSWLPSHPRALKPLTAACGSRKPPLRDSQSSAALTCVPERLPPQTLLVASAVASARAACPSGTSLDTSIENFPAAHRIATDDAAYGASDVTVASDFSVHYDTYFKVVRTYCGVHTPYSCVPRTYVLTLCGATAPTTYTNGTALPEDAKHFTIPVTGIGLPGSTPVTFVEMLDLRDAIELVNPQYVHSPCVQKLEETEQIDTVDTDWAARAAAHEDVQVVFTDSWNTAQIDKDVVFDASSDPGALARAEWIKFMSVFFNEEEKANLYFAREKAAFEATAASTASLSAALYADAANRKTCAWVQKYVSWTTGATEYHVSYSVYKQELCVGAGMTPATDAVDLALDAPAYKMVFTSLADFHAKLVTYDVIIDETYQLSPPRRDEGRRADQPRDRRRRHVRRAQGGRSAPARGCPRDRRRDQPDGRQRQRPGLVRVRDCAARARADGPRAPRLARRHRGAGGGVLALLPRRARRRDADGERQGPVRHLARRGDRADVPEQPRAPLGRLSRGKRGV